MIHTGVHATARATEEDQYQILSRIRAFFFGSTEEA